MAWGAAPVGNRIIAAARAVGAPKPSPTRYLNKASGKMESKAQLKAYKAPTQNKNNPNPHVGHPGQNHPANVQPSHTNTGGGESLGLSELSPAQTAHRALKLAQGEQKVALAPLQNNANELRGQEATSQQRYAGVGQAQNAGLTKIGEEATASALTQENQAAQNAIKATQGIETSGQAQAGQSAGYVNGELAQELKAESQRAGATGAAANALSQQQGTNETNYMANLRAAAASKVIEGAGSIANKYGKALGENANKQAEVNAKVSPNYVKNLTNLSKEQFNERATASTLKLKSASQEAKEREGQQKIATTVRGQNITKGLGEAKNAIANAKLSNEARKLGFTETSTKERNEISKLNAEDKKRYDEAQTRYKEALTKTGKPPSPKEGRTYMAKLSTAEQIARGLLGNEPKSKTAQAKAREELAKKGASGDVISAALNLAVYGRLGPADRKAAESYGLTKNIRPDWFRTH